MKKLLAANWKMNMPNLRSWRNFRAPKNVEVVICPPFSDMYHVSHITKHNKNVKLGAQDCFWEEKGAYTGEVSPQMLKGLGAEYVIVGHSERRRWLGETDEMINRKVIAALRAGLKAILCVGERTREARSKKQEARIDGIKKAQNYVKKQLVRDLKGIHNSIFKIHNSLIIAYEPIWAIGTGRADKPADTAEMARFIKDFLHSKFYILNSRVLYGGSVNSKNAEQYLRIDEIDGALVGGASLNPAEFARILGKVKNK